MHRPQTAAEIVREQIFLQTHEEVPYGTTVETENWQERNNKKSRNNIHHAGSCKDEMLPNVCDKMRTGETITHAC